MKIPNIFQKSIALNTGGSMGSRKVAAPKGTGFFSLSKKMLPLLLFFFGTVAFSQSQLTLLTDYYPLCIGFGNGDNPPPRGVTFTEHIENPSNEGMPCFQVCEDSEVHYWFVEPNNIESVEWEAEGGTILNDWSTPEHKVKVKWGESGQGFLTITITLTNSTVIERVVCVDITEKPVALFEFAGLDGDKSCVNASILFENLSEEGISYQWDFGDGSYSSQFEPEHMYQNSGTYTVTLTVRSSCNCVDVYKKDIYIQRDPPILISCPGVVCENDRVTYTVNDPCPGDWIIYGGHITAGGNGNEFVEVIWDDVDILEGFGYIHYRSICGCPFWTIEKVPVVTQSAKIQGDMVVCVGEQNRYTLPQWPTTEYNWSLITDTNPTQLVWLDQRNEVIIEGLEPGNYTLRCDYKNTLLGCEGSTYKTIKIIPRIEITGENTFCASTDPVEFTTVLGNPADWTLTWEGAVISQQTDEEFFNFTFPYGGIYVLTASSGEGCASDPFIITVIDSSTDPFDAITGAQKICVGQTYTYSCPFSSAGTILVWSVTGNATIQGANTGNSVSIKYTGAGPYTVKVERVAATGSVVCYYWSESTLFVEQETFSLAVTPSAPPTLCPSSTSVFTATFGGAVPEHISWEISPSGFGYIVSGADSPTVVVGWNEVSGGITNGTLTVKATVCGNSQTETVPIQLFATPTIAITNTIPPLCPEEEVIDVAVNVTGVSSGMLVFNFGNGTPSQTKPFYSSGTTTHTIINQFTNTSPGDIAQTLTVTLQNPNGCSFSPWTTQTVTVYPQTVITIFPQYNVKFCPPSPFTHELTSNLSTGITGSETFQWYKSNISTPTVFEAIDGAESDTYIITYPPPPTFSTEGIYKLKVIDKNECEVYSQEITVYEDCSPPPCTVPGANVVVNAQWTSCNTLTANVTFNGSPTSIFWSASPGVTITSGQGTQNATFTTNIAGEHTIYASLTYGSCTVTNFVNVPKHYQAGLSIEVLCNDDGAYDLTLHNNSMVYNPPTVTYSYYRRVDSTDTLLDSGVNLDSFLLNDVTPGTYTYVLKLTSPGKPTCEVEHTITLDPMPFPDSFTISPNAPYCPNQAITLTIPDFDDYPEYTFTWNISGYGTLIASEEETDISFADGGTYNVTLTVQTPTGCILESTTPKTIVIPSSNYSGRVLPSSVNICEGESFGGIRFRPNLGSTVPHKVIWMNGSEEAGISSPYNTPFFPTESGLYWVMLEDINGCRFTNMATSAHTSNVTIRKRPYVDIIGNETLCFGETMTLVGDIVDNTLERQWLLNGIPLVPYDVWDVNNPLELEIEGTVPGIYEYTLNVRPVGDEDCGNSASFEVEVLDPMPELDFTYEVVLCEPYTVVLTARLSFPSDGHFNWSNGESEEAITVYTGGAYQVMFTDLNGCTSIYEAMVPHHTESYMWMVPKGCFDVCPWDEPAPYIIGPWAEFDYHEWIVNGNVVQSDTDSPVTDLTVDQPGTYQLVIVKENEYPNEDCIYESKLAYISPAPATLEECADPCEWGANIKLVTYMPELGIYKVDITMILPVGIPMTINFSSFNGYGTYTPGSITMPSGPIPIPPTQSYTFSFTFTPNPGFNGGDDYLVISIPDIPCITLVPIHFPMTSPYRLMPQDTELIDSSKAHLKVMPNPAGAIAAVSYHLGTEYQNAESLRIYTMLGTLVTEINLKANSGDLPLDISRFPAGTYIITLQADGNTVLHQKLIKK